MPQLTARLSPPPPPSHSRRSLGRVVIHGAVVGVLFVAAVELYRILVGPNFHVVIPGAIYRTSHPSPAFLEQTVKRYGIRTVVNLRGCSDPVPWYLDECRTTVRLDVAQEDVSMSAGRLPSVQAIRELVQILDRSEYPILIHCHKGIDRTGLMSAMALLLHTDAPLDVARRQLSPRYGHLPLGRNGYLDRFFDLYEEWLERKGLEHTRYNFRRFAENEYCPAACSALIQIPEQFAGGLRLPRDEPIVIPVRCVNTSVKLWQLKPGPGCGVSLRYQLFDADDHEVAHGFAGLFETVVHPGDSIDLRIVLPPFRQPGRYMLRADMLDGEHALFFQTGSEPLLLALEVP